MSYPGGPSFQISYPEFAYNVVPSDATAGPCPWRILYIGGAGNVSFVDMGSNTVVLTGVVAGQQVFVGGKRVNATGTTATNIVALV